MFDTLASIEQKLIKTKRTIALEMKAIVSLEAKIHDKRANVRALQADQERFERLLTRKGK